MTDDSELVQIQIAGADAHAEGWHRFDNPFFRTTHAPAVTGDAPALWRAKKDAWDRGFCRGYAAVPLGPKETVDRDQEAAQSEASGPEGSGESPPLS